MSRPSDDATITTATRYAIYYAPESSSPLWRFGSSVLGYDAETGGNLAFPQDLVTAWPNWAQLTGDPRKYGFHATLKAPFRLGSGKSEADLLTAARAFASSSRAFSIEALRVATIGRFVALVPAGSVEPLQALAAGIVDAFEPFRAPLTEADRARRLKSSLTRAQTFYLDTYGYPYVHDEFRFHMTLTGGLPSEMLADVNLRLSDAYVASVPSAPVTISGIAVFRQDHPANRFRIIARLPLL